jgi:hypothetical protein
MNLYEYALGNPTRYVDPNGAQAETPLRYPLGNPANAGELSKDLSDKLIKWLTDDCNIDPGRPSKKSIRFEFPKCTLATDIIPSIVPSGMMKCAAGKLDKAQQKTQLGKALAAAVSIAGYFDSPDPFGLNRDGEYCGYIEITKEFSFKHSEKPPIIISRAFWLTFDIQLRGCNTEDVNKKFRLDLLQWTEEFKDEPVKIGDGVPPPKEPPRPPVGTK